MLDIVYLDDVVEEQGNLFALVSENGYDLRSFTEFYLSSKIRRFIDEGSAYYATLLGQEIYQIEIVGIQRLPRSHSDSLAAEWVGQLYALLQFKSGKYSIDMLKKYSYNSIYDRYGVLHDMDIDLVADKLLNRR